MGLNRRVNYIQTGYQDVITHLFSGMRLNTSLAAQKSIIENKHTSLTTSYVLHKIVLYFYSFNNFNKRIALFRWQKHDLYKSRKLLLQAICTKLIKFPRQQTTEIMAGTIIYLSNNEIRALKIGWKNWQSRKERLSTIVVQTCDSARVMGRQTGRSTAHVNHA